ncbi:LytR/AlgR family response regulator transcription factor [Cloacibacillus evryensis]|uniref:LytR/AlgR family response regulator transcription factor n=1 Tax=Cloacibacillus evryensis TaxID=508460 RepID=UPI00241FEB83|nr:LytTR family DNA-binding domain-containing protein [Cloacibacillus evryensis]
MFRIAICDDESRQRRLIRNAAEQYFSTHRDRSAEICEYADPLALSRDLVAGSGFDILMLDVCMPELSGTEIARVVRRRGFRTEVVFFTFSGDYAVDAFELKAAHYLVKPFSQKQFDEAMERALKNLAAAHRKTMTLKLEGGSLRAVDTEEVIFIESSAHSQKICLSDASSATAKQSMALLMEKLEELSPGQFVSPYKGYIINLRRVVSIEADCVKMQGGAEIPLVRRSFRELRDRYFDCMFADGEAR